MLRLFDIITFASLYFTLPGFQILLQYGTRSLYLLGGEGSLVAPRESTTAPSFWQYYCSSTLLPFSLRPQPHVVSGCPDMWVGLASDLEEAAWLPPFAVLEVRKYQIVLTFLGWKWDTAAVLFLHSWGPTQIPFFLSSVSVLLWSPLALFSGFFFMRTGRENQFYATFSGFEVVCASPLICKTGIIRKRTLWGDRGDALPGCSSAIMFMIIFPSPSPRSHVPPCPCCLGLNFSHLNC